MKRPNEIIVALADRNLYRELKVECERRNVHIDDAFAQDRSAATVFARSVVWALLARGGFGASFHGMSCAEIGRIFGMHHTTIMHALKKVPPDFLSEAVVERQLQHLKARIEELEDTIRKLQVSQRAQLKRIDAMSHARG